MKVQQDSFEERPESPEPLYEEVGDFGLQVLKSLETSFLSGSHANPQDVPERPLSLSPRQTASLELGLGLGEGYGPARPLSRVEELALPLAPSLEALAPELGRDPRGRSVVPVPRRQPRRPCSPSQELLLQELSSVFTKKPEMEPPQPAEDEPI